MANETIMLAKTFSDSKKLTYPGRLTEKLDGVPGDFYYRRELGMIHARSRQGEELHSVPHIKEALTGILINGMHVIGELWHPDYDFKEISGFVRRKEPCEESLKLTLNVFDAYVEGKEDTPYQERMVQLADLLIKTDKVTGHTVRIIPGKIIENAEEFDEVYKNFILSNPTAEGVVFRTLSGPKSYWKAAWRSPGMVKRKITETEDLPIHGFEEAVSKEGDPLGMVGRIEVLYKGNVIGVGPGKLKHAERVELWENQKDYIDKTIEVAYMPDPSYDALREARFHRFRPDKDK